MKRELITILSVLALPLFVSCNRDSDLERYMSDFDVVPTISVKNVTATAVTFNVYVPKGYPQDGTVGVCYSTEENPTVKDACVEHEDRVNGGNKTVAITVTDLVENTMIYAKAYIKSNKLVGKDVTYSSQTIALPSTPSEITIGEATTSGYNTPFGNYYKYSTSAQIYTASEIGRSGTIDRISFYCQSTGSIYSTVKVYMVTTNKSYFANNSDWTTSATQVYSSYIYLGGSTGWFNIQLDNGYFYNSSAGNLMIIVTKSSSSYSSSQQWRYTTTAANTALYRVNDSETGYANIANAYSGTTTTQRPNIKLHFQ